MSEQIIDGDEWLAEQLKRLPTWGKKKNPQGAMEQKNTETIHLDAPLVVPKRGGIKQLFPALKSRQGSFIATPKLVSFIKKNPHRFCIELEAHKKANEFAQILEGITLYAEGALNGIKVTGAEGSRYRDIEVRDVSGIGFYCERVIRAELSNIHVWPGKAGIGLLSLGSSFNAVNLMMHSAKVGYDHRWGGAIIETLCHAENCPMGWKVESTTLYSATGNDVANSAEVFFSAKDSGIDRCTWTQNQQKRKTSILVDGETTELHGRKTGDGRKRLMNWEGNIWG